MTSDEIRKVQRSYIDESNIESSDEMKTFAIIEIAFQLAKLNEHFEMVDNAVFGGKK